MLSRTAENLFWIGRYVERADSTARLIEMGRRMVMLPSADDHTEWRSILAAAGAAYELEDGVQLTEAEAVRILLLEAEKTSSIRSCLGNARANARAVRTALTQEMWEAINDGWRKLETVDSWTARRDLPQIIDWVKQRTSTLRGALDSGMLRSDGYDFLRLGGFVERADMMLRLLDVKYYVLLPETEVVGGGRDHHQWTSLLHANNASRAYHHLYPGDYSPWKISDFLILNRNFPRSLAYSYSAIGVHLDRLATRYETDHTCNQTVKQVIAEMDALQMGEIFQRGLHQFIQETLATNARLSRETAEAFHFSS